MKDGKWGFNINLLSSATFNRIKVNNSCLLCELHSGSDNLICSYCFSDLNLIELGKEYKDIAPNVNLAAIDKLAFISKYQYPFDVFIPQLKFHNKLAISKFLGVLLDNFYQHIDWPKVDHICPVPLHFNRQIERGYNQVEEIVNHSAALNKLSRLQGLTRAKSTKPQSELSKQQRLENTKLAFNYLGDLTGKRVLVIDDIVSTGATVSALASELKKHNANSVFVLALCINELS